MNQNSFVARDINEYIFCPSPNPHDLFAGNFTLEFLKIFRVFDIVLAVIIRTIQVGPHRNNHPAFDEFIQNSRSGVDFGEFWHSFRLVSSENFESLFNNLLVVGLVLGFNFFHDTANFFVRVAEREEGIHNS